MIHDAQRFIAFASDAVLGFVTQLGAAHPAPGVVHDISHLDCGAGGLFQQREVFNQYRVIRHERFNSDFGPANGNLRMQNSRGRIELLNVIRGIADFTIHQQVIAALQDRLNRTRCLTMGLAIPARNAALELLIVGVVGQRGISAAVIADGHTVGAVADEHGEIKGFA